MISALAIEHGLDAIVKLPPLARTKSGIVFDPRADLWKFRDATNTIHLRFDKLNATSELVRRSKPAFLWYAENTASGTVKAHFGHFAHFCKMLSAQSESPVTVVGVDEVLNYKATLHSSRLWRLWQHATDTKAVFEGVLGNPADAPLFPAKERRYQEPKGFEFHRTGASISDALTKIVESLGVISVRTGEAINITPYRFRRTTGTRAAVEGHGELIIAELLDHTDTQNVGVYVQAVPEIVERIDRAMAFHLAPLAQAFAGTIVSSEADAIRGGDPSSRVCDPRFDPSMKPMGSCGSHGFCGAMAPVACYNCRSFQPWLDGPHEAVLDYLIAEREHLLAGADIRIASINDRTILAVAEVVARCNQIKSSSAEGCHV